MNTLKIAVASGKGGTGKTTVSTNLAMAAAGSNYNVCYMDCDVEEPNGHLFLKPVLSGSYPVTVPVPRVDEEKCIYCGACGDICQYSAILCLGNNVLTFEKMCHGCGGCTLACSAGAITEEGREIGTVEEGHSGAISFVQGRLKVGEAMSPPLIKAVRSNVKGDICIIDVPPGTSCPVITAVKDSDFVILVTEPTPFGVNDLGLAIDMLRELDIPHAVVVNRQRPGDNLARELCGARGVQILAEIPDDREVAEAYSRGEMAYSAVPGFRERFCELLNSIESEAGR